MSMVRFATLCDLCGRRSEEYSSWPTCRHCGADVCPKCSSNPGTVGVTFGEYNCDGERDVADCRECVPSLATHIFEAVAVPVIVLVGLFVIWAWTL